MKNEKIVQNSIKAWVLAARPKTLAAAAVPIVLASSLALTADAGLFHWTACCLCFLFAFVMQIDANFVNDYFDFRRGNDDETRLGPKRACAEGWVSGRAMIWAIIITTTMACIIGLPLIAYGGMEMILVGIACILFCFLYTTTFSYIAMGDILVLLFFGIVPVCCTYYVELAGTGIPLPGKTLWMSVACGLFIDTLLIINNYRDYDNDKKAGKRTLAVIIGKKAMSVVYLMIVPASLTIGIVCLDFSLPSIAVTIIILAFHLPTWKKMVTIGQGRALNKILGMTARNILLYGILTSISIILS